MGTYRIHAQRGDLVAETTVEVAPSEFTKSLLVPERPRRGQVMRIWFGHLPPGQELPAHLFRSGANDKWVYVAGLGSIQVDSEGFAMIAMRSRATDPAGAYLLVTEPIHVLFTLRK